MVINSLRGGAAGGGTRMHPRLDRREVESLAKTMEVKFSVSGPQIGGAKSGIVFDPSDPRKEGVLRRWYAAVTPLLKSYYGTGGDMNVDEIHEVIPITEDCGIWHPQEGVFNGHFNAKNAEKVKRIGQLRQGVSKIVDDTTYTPNPSKKYRVADLITGYGVVRVGAPLLPDLRRPSERQAGRRPGLGQRGSGGSVLPRSGRCSGRWHHRPRRGIIAPQGLSFEEVTQLFEAKQGNSLNAADMLSFDEVNARIWDVEADVFLPCAASRLITQDQLNRMVKAGVEVISSGANVPFADAEIFYGPMQNRQMVSWPWFRISSPIAAWHGYLPT